MFVDANTAWILAMQRMQDQFPSEYQLMARWEIRQRRLARRAWWRALMLRLRTGTTSAKRAAVA